MALTWDWKNKIGELLIRQGEHEFTMSVYEGNSLAIFLHEFTDKDGVEKWREKVSHLLSDTFSIYVGFFDRYWIEADGKKADIADIQLRLLCHPETDRQAKVDYEARMKGKAKDIQTKPDGVLPEEWLEHSAIMRAIREWNLEHAEDEPFLDPIELQDPRVREWRETLRKRYNNI